jgi:hypothetical protein
MSNAREIAQLGSVPSGRRRINHNGAMTVAQRGTSDTVTSLAKFVCDRWAFNYANTDELAATVSQDTDAPDGFAYSFKWTTNTGETSVASDEYAYVYQKIEGQDLQSLSYGSASAKPVTLSFWVKSSVTGTYAAGIYAADGPRIINLTYTINSANTWEYKTITFAGDVAGTINSDTGEGLRVLFHLAAGSGWTTTDATSWVNYTTTAWAYGHAQNGVITTTNATWQITGIQLEVGSVATEFEHRSYGEELALCQRYYQKCIIADRVFSSYNNSSASYGGSFQWRTIMRVAPTSSGGGNAVAYASNDSTPVTGRTVVVQDSYVDGCSAYLNYDTAGAHSWFVRADSLLLDAEL